MTKHRINPDTGIIEEQDGFIEEILDLWGPSEDEDGDYHRINPDTGVLEEQSGFIEKLFGIWGPSSK